MYLDKKTEPLIEYWTRHKGFDIIFTLPRGGLSMSFLAKMPTAGEKIFKPLLSKFKNLTVFENLTVLYQFLAILNGF